jgi:lysophospholipase L1-like esterase/YbbR domain-containing protein
LTERVISAIKDEEGMREVGKNSRLFRIWIILVPILLFSTLSGSLFAERNIISFPGKEGFPYFDHQGRLSIVYINSNGRIGISRAEERDTTERPAVQEGEYGDHVNFVRVKKDKAGKTWIAWEERESGKSDIYIAQLRNKKLTHPTKVTNNRGGFNFSPCIDFSYGNDPWVVWVNYSQKKYLVLVKNLSTDQTWEINSSFTSSALSPQIVIDGTEKIWIFWVGPLQNHDEILYTYFDGQRWITPLSLNQDSDVPHINPSISLDFNGFPHIVWSAYDGDDYELYYSYWDGKRWTEGKKITNNHNIADTSPCISLFLGTIPVVVWQKSQDEKNEVCLTYRMDERWISEVIISEEKSAVNSLKIVSLDNRIGIVWEAESEIKARLLHFYELYEPFLIKEGNIHSPQILALDEDKYIGFGDSITYGVIDNMPAPEKGYIPRLETLIDENIKDSQVINRGAVNEKTSAGLSRISSVINEEQAQTLFLMEGINDVKDETISMDTTAFNLKKMAERALQLEMAVFLASLIPKDPWEGMIEERVLDLNDKIKSIVSELNIYFVDQFQAFGGIHSGALYSDATHPNEQGYQLMAKTWYEDLVDTFPSIDIDPTSLDFEAKIGESNPPAQVFEISNSGAGKLYYQINVDQDWINISPTSGDARRELDEIEVTVDISNLSWGNHQGQVTITADYAPNSPQVVTINLDIASPVIELDTYSLSFEGIRGEANPPPKIFKIRNSGEETLRYQISENKAWLSVSPTSGESDGEWDEIEVSVNISNLSQGNYQGQVSISTEDIPDGLQVVTVNLTVSGPIVELDTASFSFEGTKGESNPSPKKFKIRNSGKGTLKYQISGNKAWLSVSPASGESDGEWDEIEVSVDISSLSRGSYKGQLTITAEIASNSPQVTTAHLTVYGPEIRLNKYSLFFRGVAGEANPPSQGFKIKNSKEGKLIYQISVDKDWISVSPSSGDSSGEWDFIEVAVDISELGEENNQAQISVTAPDSSNSPQILNVSLHIQFPALFPPLNFSGEKRENRSLSQIEYINVLTWEVNPQNKFIQKYKIYLLEDGGRTLLGETDAQTFKYWHRKVEKESVYRYELRAEDEFGRESAPAVTDVR